MTSLTTLGVQLTLDKLDDLADHRLEHGLEITLIDLDKAIVQVVLAILHIAHETLQ